MKKRINYWFKKSFKRTTINFALYRRAKYRLYTFPLQKSIMTHHMSFKYTVYKHVIHLMDILN